MKKLNSIVALCVFLAVMVHIASNQTTVVAQAEIYRATSIVGTLNPDDLTENGAMTEESKYYILNKSVVFGPYDTFPGLEIPIIGTDIVVDTDDWSNNMKLYHNSGTYYFIDDMAVILTASVVDHEYTENMYRYDTYPVAPVDGIYVVASFYCPTDEFGMPGIQYCNQEWLQTASIAESLKYSLALLSINSSISQGRSNYDILSADETAKVTGLAYAKGKVEVVYDTAIAKPSNRIQPAIQECNGAMW